MEEYAYVLDYLPQGRPDANHSRREPVCYAVGETEFKLFELVPKAGANLMSGDRIYIGKDSSKRVEIDHVKKRVGSIDDMTSFAAGELEPVVEDIVRNNQDRFIKFFNTAQPISLKKHMLEELPGLGKKGAEAILGERAKEPFKDFEDLNARVPQLKGAEKLVSERIILEIKDQERRRYLFVLK